MCTVLPHSIFKCMVIETGLFFQSLKSLLECSKYFSMLDLFHEIFIHGPFKMLYTVSESQVGRGYYLKMSFSNQPSDSKVSTACGNVSLSNI